MKKFRQLLHLVAYKLPKQSSQVSLQRPVSSKKVVNAQAELGDENFGENDMNKLVVPMFSKSKFIENL